MEENKKALESESQTNHSYSISQDDKTENQNNGFIKLFRSFKDWEWYNDLPVRVLYLHCLLKANFKNTKWKGQDIKRGEFITSIAHLAKEAGLTQRQTRTALLKLKKTGEVTSKATSQYSIITLNNWDKWQSERQAERQTSDKRATTDEERKEIKNNIRDKNIFKIPTIEEIANYCLERGNNVNPSTFYDFYTSKDWMIGKNKMKDWQAAIRTWERNQKKDSKPTEEIINYDDMPYNPY